MIALVILSMTGVLGQVSTCRESPTTDSLPSVVAPMTGKAPVWIVDGRAPWSGADYPTKTLWVFSRAAKNVRIEGRRLDGGESVKLRTGDDAPSQAMVISDPAAWSVVPGGASSAVMKTYAFIPSHVFYPSPGCYEFTIRIGDRQERIVREIKLQQ
jgi:hypothetical protein